MSRYEYFDSWAPETQKKLIALDFAIRASNGTSWSDMAGVIEAANKAEAYLFSSDESAKDGDRSKLSNHELAAATGHGPSPLELAIRLATAHPQESR